MAVLGFLHRANLGLVSTQVRDLFLPVGSPESARATRAAATAHTKQLFDRVTHSSTDMFKKSMFGMVQCYNSLPQDVVDKASVKAFQRVLQQTLMAQARLGNDEFHMLFSVGRK